MLSLGYDSVYFQYPDPAIYTNLLDLVRAHLNTVTSSNTALTKSVKVDNNELKHKAFQVTALGKYL